MNLIRLPLQLFNMRLLYNPRGLGDRRQACKSFLIGSLMTSSLILLIVTEDAFVTIAALVMIVAGALLFILTNVSLIEHVFLFQNVAFAGFGAAVSLFFYVLGFLLAYLGVTALLMVVAWGRKYRTLGKIRLAKKEKV